MIYVSAIVALIESLIDFFPSLSCDFGSLLVLDKHCLAAVNIRGVNPYTRPSKSELTVQSRFWVTCPFSKSQITYP